MIKQWGLATTLAIALSSPNFSFADELAVQQDSHGTDYVTGGIGSEEVDAMEVFKKQFNLYFLFSEGKVGRVIDDINISITDSKNQTVFALEHAAPRLLLNLPSGKYQATASYLGSEQRYRFTHDAKKHQRIILNWKNKIDEDTLEAAPEDPAEANAPTPETP
ncbi:MAG TPA: hypothetical protein VNZ84_08745 [Methylophilus sp.]|nr:hypothetical protein [Methylophilus sp.]